ncbi:MAG TPA: glycosyltransferase family 2 protein [Bacteroidota bacterium]|nr:glycosyltransferase family 2 protein [Bacteroidota bacterium]
MSTPLTVITLTMDEERNIADCLSGVTWADEIIVIDSGSTDATVEIARRFTPNVVPLPWRGYGAARNAALARARSPWVLWLDADERVTPELGTEIREILDRDDPGVSGYEVARRAYFCGKWIRHGGWYPSRVVRLFRKEAASFSETRVHERLVIAGNVARARHDLLHYTDPDLHHYFSKFNVYTTLAAKDMYDAGKRYAVPDLVVRPTFQFVKMYLLRAGFLDGIHGFVLAAASSAYVFAKYAKLWELEQSERH